MVSHIFKRHVTLRPMVASKDLESQEPRALGDSRDWEDAGTNIRHDGDGLWRSELCVQAGPFLQATTQWKMDGPPQTDAPSPPLREEALDLLRP
jgi:hypothetical protein